MSLTFDQLNVSLLNKSINFLKNLTDLKALKWNFQQNILFCFGVSEIYLQVTASHKHFPLIIWCHTAGWCLVVSITVWITKGPMQRFSIPGSREQWTLCREHVNRNTVHAWSALLTSWLSEWIRCVRDVNRARGLELSTARLMEHFIVLFTSCDGTNVDT